MSLAPRSSRGVFHLATASLGHLAVLRQRLLPVHVVRGREGTLPVSPCPCAVLRAPRRGAGGTGVRSARGPGRGGSRGALALRPRDPELREPPPHVGNLALLAWDVRRLERVHRGLEVGDGLVPVAALVVRRPDVVERRGDHRGLRGPELAVEGEHVAKELECLRGAALCVQLEGVLPHEARDLRHVVLLHESLSVRPVSARHAGELAHHVIARTAPALVPAGDAGLRALILIEHVHRTLEEVDGGLLLAELVVRGREVVERGAEAERALGHVLLRDHEALLQKWDGLLVLTLLDVRHALVKESVAYPEGVLLGRRLARHGQEVLVPHGGLSDADVLPAWALLERERLTAS
mmetsp:Transcript_11679/g.39887  ORF Transcript_11679/g.39887 Transcript_11679/m.39887 type:complete len:351 (-) Transcript_11679:44-1096(-)